MKHELLAPEGPVSRLEVVGDAIAIPDAGTPEIVDTGLRVLNQQ
jgi:hypothetical protein